MSRELWEAAQDRGVRNRVLSRRNTRNEYLLQGLLVCGICGLRYRANLVGAWRGKKGIKYYYCRGKDRRNTDWEHVCASEFLRRDKAEAAVWDYISDLLRRPEVLMEGLRAHQARCYGLLARSSHAWLSRLASQ